MELKIAFLIIFVSISNVLAIPAYSQVAKVSLDMENRSIEQVMDEIERQSEFYFIFNQKQIDINRIVDIQVENKLITDILPELFKGTDINYTVLDRKILLTTDPLENNLLAIASGTESQQNKVTGTVTDEKGNPMPGVNIRVEGTSAGSISDVNGKYYIDVQNADNVLVFSFLGYISQKVTVGNKTVINISLAEELTALEEVIVVGYGTQKKINQTGAITSLNDESLSHRQVAQSSMILQGIAPGVIVTQRSGQPGLDAGTIIIRGLTTLGNNSPLILVDGIEMGINNIDPTMIESISILKDAASSSIYGSRAANGVILITTKRAEFGKMSTSYNSYMGYQRPTDIPDIVGAIDHMVLTNEAYVNVGKSPLYSDVYIQEYRDNMAGNPDKYPDTDWYDKVLTSNGFMQSHFLTMMGGTEKARIAVSLGYLDQDGNMANTNYKRYTIRFNTDIQLTKTLSTQIDAHIIKSKLTEPSRSAATAIYYTRMIPANQTGILSNGSWGEGWNGDNPIAFTQDGGISTTQSPSATMNIILKYKPTTWLYMDFVYSPNYRQSSISSFVKSIQTYKWDGSTSYISPQKSTLNVTNISNLTNKLTSTMKFDKTIGSHDVKVLLGYQ